MCDCCVPNSGLNYLRYLFFSLFILILIPLPLLFVSPLLNSSPLPLTHVSSSTPHPPHSTYHSLLISLLLTHQISTCIAEEDIYPTYSSSLHFSFLFSSTPYSPLIIPLPLLLPLLPLQISTCIAEEDSLELDGYVKVKPGVPLSHYGVAGE